MPRISIQLSDRLYKMLDEMAEDIGMSRSSIGAFAIGQYLDNRKMVKNEFFGEGETKKALLEMFKSAIKEAIPEE